MPAIISRILIITIDTRNEKKIKGNGTTSQHMHSASGFWNASIVIDHIGSLKYANAAKFRSVYDSPSGERVKLRYVYLQQRYIQLFHSVNGICTQLYLVDFICHHRGHCHVASIQ